MTSATQNAANVQLKQWIGFVSITYGSGSRTMKEKGQEVDQDKIYSTAEVKVLEEDDPVVSKDTAKDGNSGEVTIWRVSPSMFIGSVADLISVSKVWFEHSVSL